MKSSDGSEATLLDTAPSKQTLEQTLLNYHNRLLDAKEVIEQMIAMKQQMEADLNALKTWASVAKRWPSTMRLPATS